MVVKQRLLWPDLIRVVAIFLMVVLHISASYVPLWHEQSLFSWWGANLIDSLSRMCVPLFIMLSGALLLGKKDSLKVFYTKRLTRLLKPWIFWSLIYGVINFIQGNEASSIKRLIIGTFWTGFWILPLLLSLYLVAPLLNYLLRKLGNYFSLFFLLIMGTLLVKGIHFPLYFEYSFYFVLGYVLSKKKISKTYLTFYGLGTLFSWLLIASLTYRLSVPNMGFIADYYHYHTWPVVLLSTFGFMSLKGLVEVYKKKISKSYISLITNLSNASFGIYFIHMLIFRTGINIVYFPSYSFIPIISISLYSLSYFVIKKMKSNSLLNQVVG
ncbi:MAG: acyltransferase family protein [Candidatus Pacebacteria bacterium]|nr:acyltransferase family protein [Candidatus Paceibacterota bacterium]